MTALLRRGRARFLATVVFTDFSNERVGNVLYHPVWGLLVDQPWVCRRRVGREAAEPGR